MSYHGINYLNSGKMKKGNTDKTGFTWWYDQALENPNNPSHYNGFIPFDVVRKFFGWDASESMRIVATFEIDGKTYEVPVDDYKAIGRSDWIVGGIPEGEEQSASKVLSVVEKTYGVHQAKEIFIDNLLHLLGVDKNSESPDLGIESLGELKWGKRLFASLSIPENLKNELTGLEFRPILTICTSFDKTLATKYVRTFGIPVCDNTLNMELMRAGEKDGQFVLKHTKNSAVRLKDARSVLGLLEQDAESFNGWINDLGRAEVPEQAFIKWLDVMVPVPEIKKTVVTVKSIQGEDTQVEKVSTNGQTIALNKRDKLVEMWDNDPRVTPWKNTRLGILQLWNTYQQHEATFKMSKGYKKEDRDNENVRKMARAESNMNKNVEDVFTNEDLAALKAISNIMSEIGEPVKVPASKPRAKKAVATASA